MHRPIHALILRTLAVLALAGATSTQALALAFTLVSHVGDDYTYTLTYGPNDNMWFVENGNVHASILMSGLHGVTAVSGPTGNDFPAGPIHDGQMLWTGSVHFGGAAVLFTMPSDDVGTGNFPNERHVFGFTLTAPGTEPVDDIQLDTNGFYNGHTLADRDVHGLVSGPGRPADDRPGRVSEAPSAALAALGLLALARRGRPGRPGRGLPAVRGPQARPSGQTRQRPHRSAP